MERKLTDMTDSELMAVAAGYPSLDQLSDDQLAGVAVQQGLMQDEEAADAVTARKAAPRKAMAEAVTGAFPAAEGQILKAVLTKGGKVGDVAAQVVTPIVGSILGTLVEPGGGTVVGGAGGGAVGDAVAQARQYIRGERDDFSKGEFVANTAASAIPVGGPLLKGPVRTIATRGAQGAVIASGAELTRQLIDEESIDLKSLAASGGLGLLFGVGAGGVESLAVRRSVLKSIRRTPEFKDFKGNDTELVEAVRTKMAEAMPEPVAPAEPRNVTPGAEAEFGTILDSRAQPPPDGVVPAGPEIIPDAPVAVTSPAAVVAPAVKPLTELTDAELQAAAQVAVPAAPGEVPPAPGPGASPSAPASEGADVAGGTEVIEPAEVVKPKGKSLGVGTLPNGESDLLNAIEELGGISPGGNNAGGEYDGYAEVFNRGKARLLRRKGASTVDQLMGELAELGHKFESPDEFFNGVTKAIDQRVKLGQEFKSEEYGAKFDAALLENTARKSGTKPPAAISSDDLNVGTTFKVRGEPVKVVSVDPGDGTVRIKDGVTRDLPAGTPIYPDKGTVKHPAVVDDPSVVFEAPAEYNVKLASRLKQLRTEAQTRALTPAENTELDGLDRSLGQDFMDFYEGNKGNAGASLGDEKALQQADLKRRSEARLQAGDLESQIDLLGPSTDKAGQFSLFEHAAQDYLTSKGVTDPIRRAAVRSLLQGVWERQAARRLQQDLASDGRTAEYIGAVNEGRLYEERQLDLPGATGGAGDAPPVAERDIQQPRGIARDDTAAGVLGRLDTPQGKLDLSAALASPGRVTTVLPKLVEGGMPVLKWEGMKVAAPADFAALAATLRNPYQERFGVAVLDANNVILSAEVLTVGNATSALVGSDQVARALTRHGSKARQFIIWHNHPSGDPKPSPADLRVTNSFKEIAWPNGAKMSDHIITNGKRFYSYANYTTYDMPATVGAPAWEAVRREELMHVNTPAKLNELVRTVRTHDQAGALVVMLNRKNNIVALELLDPAVTDPTRIFQHAFGSAANNGATAVLIDKPDLTLADLRELQERFKATDMELLDASNARVRSFREQNVMEPRAPYGTGEGVQEAPGPYNPDAPLLVTDEKGNVVGMQQLGGLEHVKPVEMPELVKLARQLTGINPTLKNFQKARGMFYGAGSKGYIKLDRRVFRDPIQTQKTLAHEIGHAVDFQPGGTLERGNLLGRIASLRSHLATTLPDSPTNPNTALVEAERRRLYQAAGKELGKRPSKEDDEGGWAAWGEERTKRYQAAVQDEIDARRLTRDSVVRAELLDLTNWWRPYDQASASPGYIKYRESSVELYADALSVLLNAPKELKERAPIFWQGWFNYLDRKPDVKQEFFDLWTFLHRGKLGVLAERNARLKASFGKGDEIFLRKAAERDARQNTLRGIIDTAKQKHFDIFSPIIDKARAVKASGRTLPWTEDPEFVFDAHPLADNDNYRLLDRVHKQVIAPLEASGFTQDDLGLYLFHNRVLNEAYQVGDELSGRTVMANPQGITPIQARQALLKMRLDFGPERMTALEGFARKFQDEMFAIVEKGGEAGIYSPQNVAMARANRYNYATFAVLDYLEDSGHIPAAIRQQRGTLEDIANPFTASLVKGLTALKLIEHNTNKRVAVNLLSEHFPSEIQRAEETKLMLASGGSITKAKPAPSGKEELAVMVDGKPQTYWVEPEIARMFERLTPASAHAVIKVLNWTFRNIIYPMFITYNPAFQLYMSPIRDLRRSYVNLPAGVQRRKWLGVQARTWEAAKARLLNETSAADMGRRRQLRALAQQRALNAVEKKELATLDNRALVIETLATRAIGSPFDSFVRNPTREDYFGRMLQDYELLPPDKRPAWMESNILKPVRAVGGWIERTGMTFEAMPKMAAYRVLTRELGWPAHQAAEYVRNHVGVPNYLRRGQWATVDGTVMPFINVFMQGLVSDVKQATGKALGPVAPAKQRFEWWRRMAENTLVPRLLQALAAAGVLGAGLKAIYDGANEHDKANYLVLPLGQSNEPTDSGKPKSVYLRIPEDETARLLGGTIHYLVQKALNNDPAAKASLGDLVAFTGGQLPSVNPVLTLAGGWSSYASGQNPIDQFRGQKVLSNVEFNAGGWEGTKGMLAWTWRETGGANFVRWDPKAGNVTELTVSAIPGLNRLVKVTDGGHRERQQNLEAGFDKRNAQIRVAMPVLVNQLLGEYHGLSSLTAANRTPVQSYRLKALSIWHSKVWKPNYELMQGTTDTDQWKATGQALGDMSEAWKK